MKKLLIIVSLIAIIAGVGFFFYQKKPQDLGIKIPIETEEPLPTPPLKTFLEAETGITFDYPAEFATKYITLVTWPPKVQEIQKPFNCVESGSEIISAGQTIKQTIKGRDYCVTKMSEGAAGSTYTTYTYAFPYNNTTMALNFTLRFVQCGNYDEPKKSECEQERATFNPDLILDQIAQSLTFKIR